MGKTSETHALIRQDKLRLEPTLSLKISPCHQDGNRLSRRRKLAGKNPYHIKGGDNWRRDAQTLGMQAARRRAKEAL